MSENVGNDTDFSRRKLACYARPCYTVLLNKGLRLFYEKRYDEFIQTIPPVFNILIAGAKYGNMMVNMDKVKKLLSFIKEDWQRYENLPEHRILQKYSVHGRLFVLLYGGYLSMATLIFLALPMPEMIKDSKNRKNLTDLRLLFPMEYNVDHGKYYHSIIAHSYCITLLTVISIVAAESFFIIVIQHSVILFTIIGFQMKTAHVLDERILYRGDQWKAPTATKFSAQEEILVYRKIVRSIVEHNRALEYVSLVQSTFSTAIFFQIFFNVVCMSVSAVEILMSAADLDVVLGMLLWLVGQEMHLFFLCLSGQRITDSCENVYNDAIECLWYTFFAKSKVIYRFLIMNIATPRQLVAMKLLVLNMQTFQAVTRLAASYFTVLSATL